MAFKMIKELKDEQDKLQLISGEIVVDETSGKSFTDLLAEHTALKAEHAALKAESEATTAQVDVFFSEETDATPETINSLKEIVADLNEKSEAFSTKISKTSIVNDLTTGGADKVLSAEQGKALKTAVDAKISKTSIVNDLTTGGTTSVLSAEQGKALKTAIDNNAFANAETLADIDTDDDGDLTFNGKTLNGDTGIGFVANSDDTPAFTGKITFVVEDYVFPSNSGDTPA